MKNGVNKNIFLIGGLLLCFSSKIFSQDAMLANTSLRPDSSILTKSDNLYADADGGFRKIIGLGHIKRLNDLIKLEINPESIHPIKKNFSVVCFLSVQYPASGDVFQIDDPANAIDPIRLTVNYDTSAGSTYNARDCHIFKDAGIIYLKVDSIHIRINDDNFIEPFNSSDYTHVCDNLILTALIELHSEYDVNVNEIPQIIPQDFEKPIYPKGFNWKTGELCLDWTPLLWADQYQLEWTYINDYDTLDNKHLKKIPFSKLPAPDFRFNSTRVSVDNNTFSYCIPVIYESGYIVYRIRAIAFKGSNRDRPVYGKWSDPHEKPSSANSGGSSSFFGNLFGGRNPSNPNLSGNIIPSASLLLKDYFEIYSPHENDSKNWQYVASYAEDGKRKDVVSYLDGTLRTRQTVTRLNTDKTIIAGETIYDYQGRPAVAILPAPVKEQDKSSSTNSSTPVNEGNNLGALGSTGITFNNFNYALPSGVSIPGYTNGYTSLENLFDNEFGPPSLLKYYPHLNISESGSAYRASDFDIDVNLSTGIKAKSLSNENGSSYYFSDNNKDTQWQQKYLPDAEKYPMKQTEWMNDNTGRIRRQGGVGPQYQLGSGHETFYYYGVPAQMELDRVFGNNAGYAEHYKKTVVSDANGQLAVSYTNLAGKTVATALAGIPPSGLQALDEPPKEKITLNLIQEDFQREGNALISVKSIPITLDNTQAEFVYHLNPLSFNDNSCNSKAICYDCVYNLNITISNDTGFAIADTFFHIGSFASECRRTNSLDFPFTRILNKGTYTVSKRLSVDESALDHYIQDYITQTQACIKEHTDKTNEQHKKDVNPDACNTTCEVIHSKINAFPPSGSLTITDGGISYTLTEEDKNNLEVDAEKICPDSLDACKVARIGMLSDLSPGGQYAEYLDTSNGAVPVNCIVPDNLILSILNEHNQLPANMPGTPADWRHPVGNYKDPNGEDAFIEINFDGTPSYSGPLTIIDRKNCVRPQQLNCFKDFITHWKNSWAEALLTYHPEYCYLQYCENNPEFSAFADSLFSVNTYAEAKDKGFVNDLNQFNLLSHDPYDILNNETMLDSLNSFYPKETTGFFTISQVVYIAVFCRMYADDINAASECIPADFSFGHGDELQHNKAWHYYRALYLSTRNKVFSVQRNKFIHNRGCFDNQQIGFNNSEMPDHPSAEVVFGHKVKRFPDATDILKTMPVNVSQMEDYVDQLIYEKCKKCPVVSDLQAFLSEVISDGKLLQDFSIYDYYNIPQAIKSTFLVSHATTYYYKPVANNTSLTINIVAGDKKVNVCSIKFELTGKVDPNKFNWSDIVGFVCFQSAPDKSANPNGGFYAKAILKNGNYVELAGNISCLNLAQCDLPRLCSTTPTGASLKTFLTYLFSSGKFKDLAFVIYDNDHPSSPEWFPDLLANKFSGAVKFTWQMNAGFSTSSSSFDGTLVMEGRFIPSPPNTDEFGKYFYCPFHFEMADPKRNFENNLNIIGFRPDNNYAASGNCENTHFILTVKPVKGTTYEIKGNSCLAIGNCCINSPSKEKGPLCCPDIIQPPAAEDNCDEINKKIVERNASRDSTEWVKGHINAIRERYIDHCLNAVETFTAKYKLDVYHYTLYYYDQSGALVKTVPPKGVKILDHTVCENVDKARRGLTGYNPIYPDGQQKLFSTYKYNSLGELTEKTSPDAGTVRTWYDKLGRPVVSQDAKQNPQNKYSYILYDELGRVFESGEVTNSRPMDDAKAAKKDELKDWIFDNGLREEVTRIIYDKPLKDEIYNAFKNGQQFLRNRVATTYIVDATATSILDKSVFYDHATHYSYDIHGNVKELVQENTNSELTRYGQNLKHIEYDYDLVSGLVKQVNYQYGQPDQFMHRYKYDADNRITNAQTSTDNIWWDNDMSYYYYKHGPLARKVIGDEQVQGMDYAYTLQGWLKGINSNALTPENDMGHDGIDNAVHRIFSPKDVFGFSLSYNDIDYKSIEGLEGQKFLPVISTSPAQNNLFNGNIRSTVISAETFTDKVQMRSYGYDQLNRLLTMNTNNSFVANSIAGSPTDAYKMVLTYDANGNILSLLRNGAGSTGNPLTMDNLTYHYLDTNMNNKLGHVEDVPAYSGNYNSDIDNQVAGNYDYDANGNLIKDVAEGIDSMLWNMRGKLKIVYKDRDSIYFSYDALGRRVSKESDSLKTYYVTDATGNIMSIYNLKHDEFTWQCSPIYGSGRIGVYNANKKIEITPNDSIYFTRGKREYELTDHLGNVLTTISDRRLLNIKEEHANASESTAALSDHPYSGNSTFEYTADITSAHDYYPFGMMMPGRAFSSPFGTGGNLFAYNGMQTDNDLKGEGNSYTTEFRQLDPRIGRWLSVDPVTEKYPENTPFNSFGNNPNYNSDPSGGDYETTQADFDNLRQSYSNQIEDEENSQFARVMASSPEDIETEIQRRIARDYGVVTIREEAPVASESTQPSSPPPSQNHNVRVIETPSIVIGQVTRSPISHRPLIVSNEQLDPHSANLESDAIAIGFAKFSAITASVFLPGATELGIAGEGIALGINTSFEVAEDIEEHGGVTDKTVINFIIGLFTLGANMVVEDMATCSERAVERAVSIDNIHVSSISTPAGARTFSNIPEVYTVPITTVGGILEHRPSNEE